MSSHGSRRRIRLACEPCEPRALLSASAPLFAPGDLVIGTRSAVQWRGPDGATIASLPAAAPFVTGMAFHPDGTLYATAFSANRILRFDAAGAPLPDFGSNFDAMPESIVFEASGSALVGQAEGARDVLRIDPAGITTASYDVPTERKGSDWIILAPDQRTLIYTSEGRSVKRFDLAAGTPLPDITSSLPDGESFALALLPDGGLIVANSRTVVRLDADGNLAREYDLPGLDNWFALALAPSGQTFWAGDTSTGTVAQFDIQSGAVLTRFVADPSGVFGLAVRGDDPTGPPVLPPIDPPGPPIDPPGPPIDPPGPPIDPPGPPTVPPIDPPGPPIDPPISHVLRMRREGIHAQPTRLVLGFSAPLDPISASSPRSYRLELLLGRGKWTRALPIPIGSASYDPATRTVTLAPRQRLALRLPYRLSVRDGLRDADGRPAAPAFSTTFRGPGPFVFRP